MTSRPSHGVDSHTANDPVELDSDRSRFVDAEGRTVRFVPYRETWFDSLHEMYDTFAADQRSQGLPPATASAIESWLENVFDLDGPSIVAVHDDAVVGHAMFVADDDGAHELGVFVHQAYQGAGVGTNLLEAGFEHARRVGVSDVWLSVERSNRRAYDLYRRLEFTEDVTRGRSVRMSRSL